ncbi:MAG: cytochrome P450 [Proteobacteria bacterium]|nr:cytochrome P450 [Pseudomonadota bacterium]
MQSRRYPPGPDGGPFGLGNVLRFRRDLYGFLDELVADHGDVVYFQIGSNFIYLVNHPDFVRQVLVDQWEHFKKPAFFKESSRGHWGDGLSNLEGDAWRARHRLLQPLFQRRHIARYARVVVECAQDMIANWQPGTVVDIMEAILTLVVRVAVRFTFDAELEGYGPASRRQERAGTIPLDEALGVDFRVTEYDGRTSPAVVMRRRAGRDMGAASQLIRQRWLTPTDRGDILSTLVTSGQRGDLTRQQLTDEIWQLMFASHHTMTITLVWLWHLLAQEPAVEREIHCELDRVLGDEAPDRSHLPGLEYGEMVIKETMRFCMPSLYLFRETARDIHLGQYTIEQGGLVMICPYLLHRDPRSFVEPERFKPERFSKSGSGINKMAYIPFGAGPRGCIAQAFAMMLAKLVLATIARLHRLVDAPGQAEKPRFFPPMYPGQPFLMKVEARDG